jgi:hypothetical protein
MTRLEYNREIINKLSELIEKYPDWRFGQLLINVEIVKGTTDNNGQFFVLDPFYDESKDILDRLLKSRIASN